MLPNLRYVGKPAVAKVCKCDQVPMKTKIVIWARFVDFDVTLTSVLPWQPDVRFSKTFSVC